MLMGSYAWKLPACCDDVTCIAGNVRVQQLPSQHSFTADQLHNAKRPNIVNPSVILTALTKVHAQNCWYPCRLQTREVMRAIAAHVVCLLDAATAEDYKDTIPAIGCAKHLSAARTNHRLEHLPGGFWDGAPASAFSASESESSVGLAAIAATARRH